MGKLHVTAIGSASSPLPSLLSPSTNTVSTIRSAIHSKNAMPTSSLPSSALMTFALTTSQALVPAGTSLPLSSTSAIRSVVPPTSMARNLPFSRPEGSR